MDILVHGDEQNSLHPQQQINSINAWKINGDKRWHVVLRNKAGRRGGLHGERYCRQWLGRASLRGDIWAEATVKEGSKPCIYQGKSFPGREEAVQRREPLGIFEEKQRQWGWTERGGGDETGEESKGQSAKGFVLPAPPPAPPVWREATSRCVVEEWHMVVYIVKGSLAASQQVRCWIAGWQYGASQVLSHGTGERVTAWTRMVLRGVGRTDQIQEICKELQ